MSEKEKIISYLKRLSKRVQLEVTINGYDFVVIKTLKDSIHRQRYEGTINDKITLKEFKQSIKNNLALRVRRKNLHN